MSNIKHNCIKRDELIKKVESVIKRINSVGLNQSLKDTLPICLTDVNNALTIIYMSPTLKLTLEGAMSVLLTIYLEKGYKQGIMDAEAKLNEVDKKLEDIH